MMCAKVYIMCATRVVPCAIISDAGDHRIFDVLACMFLDYATLDFSVFGLSSWPQRVEMFGDFMIPN